jgi:hypothetical protein
MKQIFDWLRGQINGKKIENSYSAYSFRDDCIRNNAYENALEMVDEAEAKWEADCCEWWFDRTEKFWRCSCEEGQDYEVDAPDDNGYKFCPYCGRKISEVE